MLEPREQHSFPCPHGVHHHLLSQEPLPLPHHHHHHPPLRYHHHHHHHHHHLPPPPHYHPQHYHHNPNPSFGAPHSPSLCPFRYPRLVPCVCTNCGSWNYCCGLSHPPFSPLALTPSYPCQRISQEIEKSFPQELPVSASGELEEPSWPQNLYDRQCDEEEDIDDESFELVLTDEWAEFFAKSKARRREKKRQQKKEAKARNAIANKEQENTVESEMAELSLKEE